MPQFESISSFARCLLYGPALTTVPDPGKTVALTRRTLVDRAMSQLFNTLSRFVLAFLPRNNHLLISGLQSLSAVILEPRRGHLSLLPHFPLRSA